MLPVVLAPVVAEALVSTDPDMPPVPIVVAPIPVVVAPIPVVVAPIPVVVPPVVDPAMPVVTLPEVAELPATALVVVLTLDVPVLPLLALVAELLTLSPPSIPMVPLLPLPSSGPSLPQDAIQIPRPSSVADRPHLMPAFRTRL
jgi:hypothetical protein